MSNVVKTNLENLGKAVYISPKIAMQEAARCLLCFDAPCSKNCPAGTDPAKFIRSVRLRNIKGAAETIRENNPLGAVCAYTCPHEKFCEKACSAQGLERPIRIGMLQSFVTQQEKIYDMQVLKAPVEKKNKKIACIGAGPSSLTIAAKLAMNGYDVTIFEKEAKAGGMVIYGIAPVRLPEEILDFDLKQIEKLGVKFVFNKKVTEVDLKSLEKTYDAIFVGIGLWGFDLPKLQGAELRGNYSAVDFLRKFRTEGCDFVKNRRVVVVGGGDVAMDCAITAKTYGASDVKIVYRRTLEESPAQMKEICNAVSRGISLITEMAPICVSGKDSVETVSFEGYKDKTNKLTLATDIVVFATGMKISLLDLPDKKSILTEAGLLATKDGMVGGKYFASGDAVHGAKTVVEAVKAAKETADYMMKYLENLK